MSEQSYVAIDTHTLLVNVSTSILFHADVILAIHSFYIFDLHVSA